MGGFSVTGTCSLPSSKTDILYEFDESMYKWCLFLGSYFERSFNDWCKSNSTEPRRLNVTYRDDKGQFSMNKLIRKKFHPYLLQAKSTVKVIHTRKCVNSYKWDCNFTGVLSKQQSSANNEWQKLKRSYRSCRDKLKTSGQSRTLCKYYTGLNGILEGRSTTTPTKVIHSMVCEQVLSDFETTIIQSMMLWLVMKSQWSQVVVASTILMWLQIVKLVVPIL